MLGLFGREREIIVHEQQALWGSAIAVEERYRALVERLEQQALASPGAYRLRVLLAGMLGYVVIALLALALIAIMAGVIWLMIDIGRGNFIALKVLLVVGALLIAMGRGLWVRFAAPEGRPVTPSEAPRLFEVIHELRARIGGPRIHEVLISDDLNAAIVQRPRLGLFGWYRNYLVLGLPLLEALPEEEVKSVIAHELGHFAGNHGRLASSVYRVRTSWAQLSEQLQSGFSASLLRAFFRWYGPWFNAYSFALARANEYEADRAAANVVGADAAGSALVRITVESARFEDYWQSINRQVADGPVPLASPYAGFRAWFGTLPEEAKRRQIMRRAFRQVTGLDDTHPCLTDRLAALGVGWENPLALRTSAAQSLLGPLADTIAAQFDGQWRSFSEEGWRRGHEECRQAAAELAQLEERAAACGLDREQRHRHAGLVRWLRGDGDALPLYDALASEATEDHAAAFHAAQIRLQADDPAGIEQMEHVARAHPPFAMSAYGEIAQFHFRREDEEAETRAWEQFSEMFDKNAAADVESRSLRPTDQLDAPNYSEELRYAIQSDLAGLGGLKNVLVGLRLLSDGDRQQIILFECDKGVDPNDLIEDVGNIFGAVGNYMALSVTPANRWLRKRLRDLDGARLYP